MRQLQLESRKFQCQKSEKLKRLTGIMRQLELQARSLQQNSLNESLCPDDVLRFEAQIQEMDSLYGWVRKDHGILKSLAFRSSVARHDTIPEAHKRTFSWVFAGEDSMKSSAHQNLRTWLRRGSGIFWVSGKPGAGKSTLMKFIADSPNTEEALAQWSAPKKTAIVSHYFWCAGTPMQRSQNGLLQTLLFEILRQLPDAIQSLFPERWDSPTSSSWAMDDLYQALLNIVSISDLPVKFCFFIDGLDEFDGDHLSLCQELMLLARSGNVKLCLSSRPWSVFEEAFGSDKAGQLCLHDVTKSDITCYVLDKFSEQPSTTEGFDPEYLQSLAAEVTQRSQGVFLWVALATKCLLEELKMHCDPSLLIEKLQEYPPELDDFFTYNLVNTRLTDRATMASSLLITQAAKKPLDVGIYYFHAMEKEDSEYAINILAEPPSRLEHRRQLSQTTQQLESICRGLLSVDKKTGVVNCLHRTVRDYIDSESTRAFLGSKSMPGFSPNASLLKASVAWVKTSRATMSEEPKAELVSSISSLLAAVTQMHTSNEVALCRQLLDSLDTSLNAKGPGAEESLQLLRTHIVRNRVWQYLLDVQTRLPQYFSLFDIPALVLALFPDYEIGDTGDRWPHWDAATAKTVSCLLKQGQCPNNLFSTAATLGSKAEKTPWAVLCEHIMPQHDDGHTIHARKLQAQFKACLENRILDDFLSNGANPSARCHRPGKEVSVVSTDYLLYSFRLDLDNDPTLEALYLEHLHWFTPKDPEHFDAVIKDFFRLRDRTEQSEKSGVLQRVSEKLLDLASQLPIRRR